LPTSTDPARANNDDAQRGGVELPSGPRHLTALETLAEVSRQIGRDNDDQMGDGRTADRLEMQEQYTLDNPPVSYEHRGPREKKGIFSRSLRETFLTDDSNPS
jgi:hypothetical protein